jgi:hypothetical protein
MNEAGLLKRITINPELGCMSEAPRLGQHLDIAWLGFCSYS